MFPLTLLCAAALGAVQNVSVGDRVVASDPVIVFEPSAGGVRKQAVELLVTNYAGLAVTAWGADVEVRFANDGVKRFAQEVDGYAASAVGDTRARGVIPVNGFVRARGLVLDDETALSEIRVSMNWAIFADGTWLGTSTHVEDAFRQREADFKTQTAILEALQAGRPLAGFDALRVALDRLSAIHRPDRSQADVANLSRNIQMVIDGRLKVRPEEFLASWIGRTQALAHAADEHRHAKNP